MKKIHLIPLVLLISFNILSQESPLKIDFTPKSPEVSSLFDYSEISVGNNAGTAEINLPITELKSGPLSTLVSLSYSTSGNKVTDRATWVGLGWNLNAGGYVTREIRGIADDSAFGVGFLEFINGYSSVGYIFGLPELHKFGLYSDLSAFRCKDAEPDLFSFRVGNLSGTFMFDWDGTLKISCNRKVKVSYQQSSSTNEINEWSIIDDYGNKYIFSKKETNEITNILGMGAGACDNQPYTSMWKLTSIEDSSGIHTIDFTYDDYFMEYPIKYSKQHEFNKNGGHVSYHYTQSGFEINGSYLNTITCNNSQNKITFSLDLQNPRTDVNGTNLYPLGKIELKNGQNEVLKTYNFDYTLSNRLKLDGVRQTSNGLTIDFYQFEYDNTSLPDYNSYATDHWGYYNGISNSEPYPPYIFVNANNAIVSFSGANKEPDPSFTKASILEKIIYPTKGYTKFIYENHDYSFIQSDQIPSEYEQTAVSVSSTTLGIPPPNPNDWVEDETFFTVDINTTTSDENTFCSGGVCLRLINLNISARNLYPFATGVNSPRYFIYDENDNVVASLDNHNPSYIPGPNDVDYCNGSLYHTSKNIWLGDGNYRLVTTSLNYPNGCNDLTNFITTSLSYVNDSSIIIDKKQAGGLRIKDIENFDSNNILQTKKSYKYILETNPNLSSGSIPVLPKYEDVHQFFITDGTATGVDYNLMRYSGSLLQLGSTIGHVTYEEVIEEQVVNSKILKKKYKYSKDIDLISTEKPYPPPIRTKPYLKGRLLEEINYEDTGTSFLPVSKITYQYNNDYHVIEALKIGRKTSGDCNCSNATPVTFVEGPYYNYLGHSQIINREVTNFYDSQSIEQNNSYVYDSNLNRIISETIEDSDGDSIVSINTFPDTDTPSTINNLMITKNIVGIPIKVETIKNSSTLLSTQITSFKDWGTGIIAPEFLKTSKSTQSLETIKVIHSYDSYGNPREVSQEGGAITCFLWGYHGQYPVAKIDNKSFNLIPQSLRDAITTASNSGNEQSLLTALADLRNHSSMQDALVTGYTYKPLIGISTITDPKGLKNTYEYDDFGRLKYVIDHNGNLLSKNEYNYGN